MKKILSINQFEILGLVSMQNRVYSTGFKLRQLQVACLWSSSQLQPATLMQSDVDFRATVSSSSSAGWSSIGTRFEVD